MAGKLEFLYVGCDNLIELVGVRRADTGAYLNAATATWGLYASKANAASQTMPLATGSLSYVAASDGVYQGTIESDDYDLVDGTDYWLRLTASQSGIDDTRILRRRAKYHEESP